MYIYIYIRIHIYLYKDAHAYGPGPSSDSCRAQLQVDRHTHILCLTPSSYRVILTRALAPFGYLGTRTDDCLLSHYHPSDPTDLVRLCAVVSIRRAYHISRVILMKMRMPIDLGLDLISVFRTFKSMGYGYQYIVCYEAPIG